MDTYGNPDAVNIEKMYFGKNTNIILRDKKPYSDHKPIGLILSTTFMSGGRRKYSTKKHTKKHTKKRTLKSNKFTKIDKTN